MNSASIYSTTDPAITTVITSQVLWLVNANTNLYTELRPNLQYNFRDNFSLKFGRQYNMADS